MVKLINTKNGREYEEIVEKIGCILKSKFFEDYREDYEFVRQQYMLNKDIDDIDIADMEIEKDFVNIWNCYSDGWTSPKGVKPIYEMIEFKIDIIK